jgi:hypothetical protein
MSNFDPQLELNRLKAFRPHSPKKFEDNDSETRRFLKTEKKGHRQKLCCWWEDQLVEQRAEDKKIVTLQSLHQTPWMRRQPTEAKPDEVDREEHEND